MQRLDLGTNKQNDFHQVLSEDDLIAGIRQYVSKNKQLPEYFAALDANPVIRSTYLSELMQAIDTANYESDIFCHPRCADLILYAVERKEISFWSGMTAYVYVMALAQFTAKRQLKQNDFHLKAIRNLSVVPLVEDGCLTVAGAEYLDSIYNFLNKYGANPNYDALRKSILDLPAFEQSLVRIDRKSLDAEGFDLSDVDHLLDIMLSNLPICVADDMTTMYLPSHGVINVVLQQIEKTPVQMKPVLGSLSDATRDALHAKDQHPLALYSNAIKSNVPKVHSLCAGPIPVWLHDVGHVLWGTLLGVRQRELINRQMLPMLEKAAGTENNLTAILNLRNHIADYDLSPIQHYPDISKRLAEYFKKAAMRCVPQTSIDMDRFDSAIKQLTQTALKSQRGLDALGRMFLEKSFKNLTDAVQDAIEVTRQRSSVYLLFVKKTTTPPVFALLRDKQSEASLK